MADGMDLDEAGPSERYEPAGPKPIRKLSKDVVNHIAAAEVPFSDHRHEPTN